MVPKPRNKYLSRHISTGTVYPQFDMVLPKIQAHIFTDVRFNIWSLLNSKVLDCFGFSSECLKYSTQVLQMHVLLPVLHHILNMRLTFLFKFYNRKRKISYACKSINFSSFSFNYTFSLGPW